MALTEYRNIVRGMGLGVFIASGLSAWATFLRLVQGTAPFERAGTPYAQTVLIYYLAFTFGGAIIGALQPLRRWALGSMLLGVLFVAPVYASFVFLDTSPHGRFSTWNVLGTLAASIIVGGGAGLWVWSNELKGRP
ncbi:MAG: hypothetical protein ACREN6_07855 [Gemmatimonadaceae bacterium]